jgi:hypothetical protein
MCGVRVKINCRRPIIYRSKFSEKRQIERLFYEEKVLGVIEKR